ncbi:hypothetical protein NLX83_17230 [Allokutzneria sp. A3M-2-11 16]|uniref:hypothetical protein n=1 Tax=Allokutzneria sp. A3M-2-11 16 TaxID=2962043 RepID=UPI0020B8FEBB|nr:hypothetical protein [Allokutzneria sp. A3M-2-11 16]MCP3801010.1 hypothetical protein [Allokutzneria sp. A3M-2-11 16]
MQSPKFVRRFLLTLAPPVLVLGAALLTFHSLAERLPDPLAAHVGPSGRTDSYLSGPQLLSVFSFPLSAISLLCLGMFVVARRNPHAQRFLVMTSFAVGGLHAAIFAVVMTANLDVADARTVVFGWWTLPLPLLAAVLSGALGYALAGKVVLPKRDDPLPADAPRLELAEGERVSWSHTMTSRLPLVGATVMVVAALALGFTVSWHAAIIIVPALLLVLTASVRITVDGNGLSVRSALLRRPRKQIALEQIKLVRVRTVDPFRDFGGWGYRHRGGASGVVLRAGDALVVELDNDIDFVVTVDDADTAAALLNSLAERARTRD